MYVSKYELAFGFTGGSDHWWGRATHRTNFVTGELIELPSWVSEIAPEDLEWFERQWCEEDEFDYRLLSEGVSGEWHASSTTRTPPTNGPVVSTHGAPTAGPGVGGTVEAVTSVTACG